MLVYFYAEIYNEENELNVILSKKIKPNNWGRARQTNKHLLIWESQNAAYESHNLEQHMFVSSFQLTSSQVENYIASLKDT